MTRAVAIVEPGGPEVLRVIERDVRDPGPGEVRLAVRAAAVNPTDIALRQRGDDAMPPPWVPGMDAAGTVESVGAGVDRLAVGDEVMAAVTSQPDPCSSISGGSPRCAHRSLSARRCAQ